MEAQDTKINELIHNVNELCGVSKGATKKLVEVSIENGITLRALADDKTATLALIERSAKMQEEHSKQLAVLSKVVDDLKQVAKN